MLLTCSTEKDVLIGYVPNLLDALHHLIINVPDSLSWSTVIAGNRGEYLPPAHRVVLREGPAEGSKWKDPKGAADKLASEAKRLSSESDKLGMEAKEADKTAAADKADQAKAAAAVAAADKSKAAVAAASEAEGRAKVAVAVAAVPEAAFLNGSFGAYSGPQRYDVLFEERNYAVSSILRNLSFVAEDEDRLARHPGTLRLLWRWLQWNDTHRGPGFDTNPRGLGIVKNALDCLGHIGHCINLTKEQSVTGENLLHQLIRLVLFSDEERVVRAMDALSRLVIVPDNDAHVERYFTHPVNRAKVITRIVNLAVSGKATGTRFSALNLMSKMGANHSEAISKAFGDHTRTLLPKLMTLLPNFSTADIGGPIITGGEVGA